ncbi:hypothetical protein BC629DRAFT_1598887 [Irpex lacteus]|nr:hypothetical protein BC629DRAFT_1598887 [Irpex lacteus]
MVFPRLRHLLETWLPELLFTLIELVDPYSVLSVAGLVAAFLVTASFLLLIFLLLVFAFVVFYPSVSSHHHLTPSTPFVAVSVTASCLYLWNAFLAVILSPSFWNRCIIVVVVLSSYTWSVHTSIKHEVEFGSRWKAAFVRQEVDHQKREGISQDRTTAAANAHDSSVAAHQARDRQWKRKAIAYDTEVTVHKEALAAANDQHYNHRVQCKRERERLRRRIDEQDVIIEGFERAQEEQRTAAEPLNEVSASPHKPRIPPTNHLPSANAAGRTTITSYPVFVPEVGPIVASLKSDFYPAHADESEQDRTLVNAQVTKDILSKLQPRNPAYDELKKGHDDLAVRHHALSQAYSRLETRFEETQQALALREEQLEASTEVASSSDQQTSATRVDSVEEKGSSKQAAFSAGIASTSIPHAARPHTSRPSVVAQSQGLEAPAEPAAIESTSESQLSQESTTTGNNSRYKAFSLRINATSTPRADRLLLISRGRRSGHRAPNDAGRQPEVIADGTMVNASPERLARNSSPSDISSDCGSTPQSDFVEGSSGHASFADGLNTASTPLAARLGLAKRRTEKPAEVAIHFPRPSNPQPDSGSSTDSDSEDDHTGFTSGVQNTSTPRSTSQALSRATSSRRDVKEDRSQHTSLTMEPGVTSTPWAIARQRLRQSITAHRLRAVTKELRARYQEERPTSPGHSSTHSTPSRVAPPSPDPGSVESERRHDREIAARKQSEKPHRSTPHPGTRRLAFRDVSPSPASSLPSTPASVAYDSPSSPPVVGHKAKGKETLRPSSSSSFFGPSPTKPGHSKPLRDFVPKSGIAPLTEYVKDSDLNGVPQGKTPFPVRERRKMPFVPNSPETPSRQPTGQGRYSKLLGRLEGAFGRRMEEENSEI